MGAAPDKSADDLVTFFNLLFDGPMHVRERCLKSTQDILETAKPQALTGEWSLFHDVFVKILSGGLDIAGIQDIINERSNQVAIVFHLEGNGSRLLLILKRVNKMLRSF